MASIAGNLGHCDLPLQGWRSRPAADIRVWRPYLPELQVVLGRDGEGSGMTISAWVPTLGEFAAVHTLYAVRWGAPIGSTEEALTICSHGVAAALAELFPPSTPA